MKTACIPVGEFGSNCWLIIDEKTNDAIIIDPSPSIEKIEATLKERNLTLRYVLLTHGHFDHMTSCDDIRDRLGVPLAVHADDAVCLENSDYNAYRRFMAGDLVYRPADIILHDASVINLKNISVKVMHTPGHTMGSVCYIAEDCIFTGDTLFDRSVGRTDLTGGDDKKLMLSLKRLSSLNGDFRIFPGHGSVTTLDKQRKFNPYLNKI